MERPEAMEAARILLAPVAVAGPDVIRYVVEEATQQIPEGYEGTNFSQRVTSFLISTAQVSADWRGYHQPDRHASHA